MGAQASFAEGMRAAKDVQKDLQWTQKRVELVPSFPIHSQFQS
jgi:exonuclease VII small subunit